MANEHDQKPAPLNYATAEPKGRFPRSGLAYLLIMLPFILAVLLFLLLPWVSRLRVR